MKKEKKKTYGYTDLSARESSTAQKFNNFTLNPPTCTSMLVYQSGHKSRCISGWHTKLAAYDHYIIHYIMSGKGTYYSATKTYPIKQGDLFLIRPSESIHYQSDALEPWTYYWVGFNGGEAFNILKLCGFSDTELVRSYTRDSALEEIFHRLAYPNYNTISREYELLGNLYQMFSLLIHTQVHQPISKSEQYLTRAIEFIQQKYPYCDLRVNDIANYVGIDRTYLYRLFYNSFQISIQDFILDLRLNKAKSLLKYSDISIGLIAFSCGFENQSYFSTIFKKHFGLTPLQYRKEKMALKDATADPAPVGAPGNIEKNL